jgi:hypothetical protein
MTSGPPSAASHSLPVERPTMNAPSGPRVSTSIAPISRSRPMAVWIEDRLAR